jgi:hypothetical protein
MVLRLVLGPDGGAAADGHHRPGGFQRRLAPPVTHERTRVFHHPTLTISKAGFNTINLKLLQDPDDI